MSRHRDAVAVAITAVAYGKWHGYASYCKVNRVLREQGLSVQKEDVISAGVTHYFDVMTDPARLDAALKAAATLNEPASEGMFYMQDEKGMAVFYILAFAVFGISSSSWYWFYVLLFSTSALTACAAFNKRSEALFLLLTAVCANAVVGRLLPTLPRIDINIIDGNRFIGIMTSLAMFHLMLLSIYRVRPTLWQVAAAVYQTVLICLTVNARTSAAWVPISIMLLWSLLWVAWLVRCMVYDQRARRPVSWSVVILMLGLAGLSLHQRVGLDPTFRDANHQEGHVLWHSLITALHNNPERTSRYGIPANMLVYDDQVGYLLFDREIARRGAPRSNYLMNDPDWVYRTSSPDLDFRWNAYDGVLRDVFIRTIVADPWYAIDSFLVQQPESVLTLILGQNFIRSPAMLAIVPIAAQLCGLLLAIQSILAAARQYILVVVSSSCGAILPVMSAAVTDIRVVELFYLLLVAAVLGTAIMFAILVKLIQNSPADERFMR